MLKPCAQSPLPMALGRSHRNYLHRTPLCMAGCVAKCYPVWSTMEVNVQSHVQTPLGLLLWTWGSFVALNCWKCQPDSKTVVKLVLPNTRWVFRGDFIFTDPFFPMRKNLICDILGCSLVPIYYWLGLLGFKSSCMFYFLTFPWNWTDTLDHIPLKL